MGLYNKSTFIALPSKKVIEDLLFREGAPTEESFTPYYGMSHLKDKQFKSNPMYSTMGNTNIKLALKSVDVNPEKTKWGNTYYAKGSDKRDYIEKELCFENIDPQYVEDYVESLLIGLKEHNSSSLRNDAFVERIAQNYLVDDEGNSVLPSDLEINDNYSGYWNESSYKEKLPFLIKKLHDGSKACGVSLLSFIIAIEEAIEVQGLLEDQIQPRHLLEKNTKNIYKVDPIYGDLIVIGLDENGKPIYDAINKKTGNNNSPFIDIKDFMLGKPGWKQHPMYKASKELREISSKLGIRLVLEDVSDYNSEYLSTVINTYIIDNKTIIDDSIHCDPRVLSAVKENLFNVPIRVISEKFRPVEEEYKRDLLNLIHNNMSLITLFYSNLVKTFDENAFKVLKPEKAITDFMTLYSTKVIGSHDIFSRADIQDCYYGDIFFMSNEYVNTPYIFDISNLVKRCNDIIEVGRTLGILSVSGHMFIINEHEDKVRFVKVTDLVRTMNKEISSAEETIMEHKVCYI